MSAPVDTPPLATHLSKATSTPDNSHDRDLDQDREYEDFNDDEDWIDMQASATFPQQQQHSKEEDHLVPTASEAKPHQEEHLTNDALAESAASLLSLPSDCEVGSSSSRQTAADAASLPLSLQVPSIASDDEHLDLDEGDIPGSATSSNSESEYSLLNPSSDQSRKNSLTGISGFRALTPTDSHTDSGSPAITDDQLSQGSQQDDQDRIDEKDSLRLVSIGVTSPSFSDFVQVGSDQGEDFSMSPHQSSNQTPSLTSSEDRARMEDTDISNINYNSQEDDDISSAPAAESKDSDRSRGAQEVSQIVTSGQGEGASPTAPTISTPAFSTPSQPISTSTTATLGATTRPCPPLPPTVSPAIKNKYKTTVEDARSSSEEERELGGSSSTGMRYRGPQAQARQDDRNDIRNSFFGAARATSTMPGGLNLGLDADIDLDHFSRPIPQPAAVPLNDPPVDERQCRICLGGADEEDTLGRLISPCLCKGSMKYVHVECLNAWRTRSPKRESHYKCDTCKYSFSFRRTSFARYLGHPLTVFVLTIVTFALAVFAAGFAMKLLLYLMMEEPQEFIYPADLSDEGDMEAMRLRQDIVIFKTPESLRAVFRIDKTHMVFGSFFVSIVGFLQLFVSTIWMGGGGGVFRIGGFGLGGGGGRRRGGRGERQGEAGVGGVLMIVILVFGLFKSVYSTYQFVNRMSRRVLAKAETMVLEVQA
ncbi:hypothetical protein BGZ95_002688 [Linnemannia exigua]|uniref:RING-CH-type domain-containing protein n=1 Tax=Linnemannia exigua TaxID=604196 RepID=A0AAD4D587_9FUNG|nr:hypothetical protein BGZ95_002688 [Linnemannia exigua]